MSSPKVTVLYFASVRTHLNLEKEEIPFEHLRDPDPTASSRSHHLTNLGAVKDAITHLHEGAALKQMLERCMWSVNDTMVDEESEQDIKPGDIVAVIPPVSGG